MKGRLRRGVENPPPEIGVCQIDVPLIVEIETEESLLAVVTRRSPSIRFRVKHQVRREELIRRAQRWAALQSGRANELLVVRETREKRVSPVESRSTPDDEVDSVACGVGKDSKCARGAKW